MSYKDAIREAMATSPGGSVILETLEVVRREKSGSGEPPEGELDVALLVEMYEGNEQHIDNLIAALPDFDAIVRQTFAEVYYSPVQYYGPETPTPTWPDGREVTSIARDARDDLAGILESLEAIRGSLLDPDGLKDPTRAGANYALERGEYLMAQNVGYDPEATRLFWVTTSRGNLSNVTNAAAAAAMNDTGSFLAVSGNLTATNEADFIDLLNATDSTSLNNPTPQELALAVSDLVIDTVYEEFSLYFVADRVPHTLTLETGEEIEFQPGGFSIDLPAVSPDGLQELSVAIDNVDRQASDFVETAKHDNLPIDVIYRPYLASDPSTMQMDSPIILSLTDVSITTFNVTGRARFVDVVGKKFPSELYTRRRFPSLGN